MVLLTFHTTVFSGPLSSIAGYTVVPFEEGISVVGSWLANRSEELGQIRDLLDENESLKAQVDELTIENTRLQQDRYELTNLRELYNLDAQYDEYEKTGARIIARDSGNWFYSFVINKGTDDGIAVDMNVMAGSGLVGRIVDVGPNWAKVKSIIADDSNVSAMVLSSSDNMIVSGNLKLYASGVIEFEQLVDSNNVVVEGDKIVTSNISDKYLPGILIGYISTINQDANNLTKSGYITPAVDFEHLEEVLVILETKQVPED
jgi:rod shape-determining protein MreC